MDEFNKEIEKEQKISLFYAENTRFTVNAYK